MAFIHRTTMEPGKLELLAGWLPSRSWYRGAGAPELAKAGGFRLDDPRGEVGVEFMVVTDGADGGGPVTYLVPLTYRGAPLEGAAEALVGTSEHGVLGRRWVYDGCQDPVLVAELAALVEGRAEPQAQGESDTPDRDIVRSFSGTPTPSGAVVPGAAADGTDGTEVPLPGGELRLHRVLTPASDGAGTPPEGALGHVAGHWRLPDGTPVRGLFATVHPARSGA
ncbi:1,4-alpha-glucan branching protein [Streptomyces sp. NPDC058045]|uniref:maltokinase N-terminal cap-like domain-containing protein n=1 Tax=Streptomyces sp. NPDC058045 TaxID=3346311 RepID=UPI0036E3978D